MIIPDRMVYKFSPSQKYRAFRCAFFCTRNLASPPEALFFLFLWWRRLRHYVCSHFPYPFIRLSHRLTPSLRGAWGGWGQHSVPVYRSTRMSLRKKGTLAPRNLRSSDADASTYLFRYRLHCRDTWYRSSVDRWGGEIICSIPGSLYTARLSSLAVNDRTWAFE